MVKKTLFGEVSNMFKLMIITGVFCFFIMTILLVLHYSSSSNDTSSTTTKTHVTTGTTNSTPPVTTNNPNIALDVRPVTSSGTINTPPPVTTNSTPPVTPPGQNAMVDPNTGQVKYVKRFNPSLEI